MTHRFISNGRVFANAKYDAGDYVWFNPSEGPGFQVQVVSQHQKSGVAHGAWFYDVVSRHGQHLKDCEESMLRSNPDKQPESLLTPAEIIEQPTQTSIGADKGDATDILREGIALRGSSPSKHNDSHSERALDSLETGSLGLSDHSPTSDADNANRHDGTAPSNVGRTDGRNDPAGKSLDHNVCRAEETTGEEVDQRHNTEDEHDEGRPNTDTGSSTSVQEHIGAVPATAVRIHTKDMKENDPYSAQGSDKRRLGQPDPVDGGIDRDDDGNDESDDDDDCSEDGKSFRSDGSVDSGRASSKSSLEGELPPQMVDEILAANPKVLLASHRTKPSSEGERLQTRSSKTGTEKASIYQWMENLSPEDHAYPDLHAVGSAATANEEPRENEPVAIIVSQESPTLSVYSASFDGEEDQIDPIPTPRSDFPEQDFKLNVERTTLDGLHSDENESHNANNIDEVQALLEHNPIDDADVSIFSLESTVSYSSSLLSDHARHVELSAVDQIVSLLLDQRRFYDACTPAIETPTIGLERFERNLQRLLKTYGLAVGKEANTMTEREAASVIHRKSRLIALNISTILKDKTHVPGIATSKAQKAKAILVERYLREIAGRFAHLERVPIEEHGESTSEASSSIGEPLAILSHLEAMKTFLVSSSAFKTLTERLESWAKPSLADISWVTRLETLINRFARNPENYECDLTALDPLRSTLADLARADPRTIVISGRYRQSWLDRTQCQIEARLATSWDWWPLPQPHAKLENEKSVVTWTCICAKRRWVYLPKKVANDLSFTINAYLVDANNHGAPHHFGQSHASVDQSQTPSATQTAPGGSQYGNITLPPPAHGSNAQNRQRSQRPPTLIGGQQNVKNKHVALTQKIFRIFLAVNHGDRLRLAQIECKGLKDDSFFEELKRQYIAKRGLLRHFFSPWRYSGCDFVKLRKYLPHRHDAQGEEMPADDNLEYEFEKPAEPRPRPPIGRHIFEDYFHYCFRGGGEGHTHYLSLLWHCRRPCRLTDHEVNKIPKRDRQVIEDGDATETYWGLRAREDKLHFVRILLYTILALGGPIAFWAIWMKGHPDDPSGAAAPITVAIASISLFSTFWMMILKSR